MAVHLGLLLLLFVSTTCAEASQPGAPRAFGSSAAETDSRLGPRFALRDRPSVGSRNAPIVVIEISSFSCSHCQQFHQRVFPLLRKQYIDTGMIQWVMLNASTNPTESEATAFSVARCALRQGWYWQVEDVLFRYGSIFPNYSRDPNHSDSLYIAPGDLSQSPALDALLKSTAIDGVRLKGCLISGDVLQDVSADFTEASALKLRITPSFIIRARRPGGRVTTVKMEGYQPIDAFQRIFSNLAKTP